MVNLSVVILTKNEEENILDCLENLKEALEVIIVDDFSTDRTLEVARGLNWSNMKIVRHNLDSDFAAQRNFALRRAKSDWVLFVDADERVSPRLFDEIKNKISSEKFVGFKIKRSDVLWGRELLYGETGNIKPLRLARKKAGVWKGRVHETWDVQGETSEIENELLHYPHQTLKDFISEINFYSSIRARELKDKGVQSSLLSIIFYTKAKFIVNYFVKLGFLDGTAGLVAAVMMSFHSFLSRSKLWLLWQK